MSSVKYFLKSSSLFAGARKYLAGIIVFSMFFLASYVAIPPLDGVVEAEAEKVTVNTNKLLCRSFRYSDVVNSVFGDKVKDDIEKSKVFLLLQSQDTGLMEKDQRSLANLIVSESKKYNQDPILTLAMIMTESTFYNWSQSRADAHGLMQIRTKTGSNVAKELGVFWEGKQTLFDPFVNIRFGIYYFNKLVKRFRDKDIALAAYNIGPTKVSRLMLKKRKIPTRYSSKVRKNYITIAKNINSL